MARMLAYLELNDKGKSGRNPCQRGMGRLVKGLAVTLMMVGARGGF